MVKKNQKIINSKRGLWPTCVEIGLKDHYFNLGITFVLNVYCC